MTRFVLELFRRSVVAEKGGGRRGGRERSMGRRGGREWRERNGIFAGHDHIGGEKGRMNRREKSSRKKKERKEGRKGKGKGKGNSKKKKRGKKKRERENVGRKGSAGSNGGRLIEWWTGSPVNSIRSIRDTRKGGPGQPRRGEEREERFVEWERERWACDVSRRE